MLLTHSRGLASFHVFHLVCLSVVLSGFLSAVASRRDSAMSRAERGEVTLSQVGEVKIIS